MTTAKSPSKKKAAQAEAAPPVDFKAMAEATRQKMAAANEKGKVSRGKKLDLNGAQRSGGKLGSREISTAAADTPAPEFQKGDLVTVVGSTLDGGSSIRGVVTGHQPTPKGVEYLVTLPAKFDGDDGEEGAYLFRADYLERRPTDPRDYSVPFQVGDRVRYFGPHAAHKGDWTVLEVLRSGSCVVGVDKPQFTLMHGHLRILGRADVQQALRDLDLSREPAPLPSETTGDALEPEQAPPAELPGTPALFAAPLLSDSMLGFYTLGQLDAWAEQPRREFDPEKLAELAESIAHKGLMQNLVGRLRGDGIVEIIAGGRRYRALKMLEEAGRLPADFTVPVRLQALSDLEALQLATAENVERSSMTPLEEADAFARMVHLGAMPEDIALKFGYSLKTVQQRLVLAEGLGEEGRKLFSQGKIGLGQAQIIAQTTGPLRKHVVKAAAGGSYDSTIKGLQELIKNSSFLVGHAKFDVAASGLEVIQDLYGDQPARFADPKAALALQLDWVQARAKELEGKKEQHFVDVCKENSRYLSLPYDTYTTYNAPKSVLGTVIMVSTVTGEVKESRCAREADLKSARAKEQAAERQKASSEATGSEGAAIRKQGWIDGHEARATALRSALVGDHKRAVALTILMMLEASPVDLRASLSHTQAVAIPAGITRLQELDTKLGGKLQVNGHHKPQRPLSVKFGYGIDAAQPAREYLDLLLTLSLEELLDVQSILIAQAVGGWSSYNPVHAPYPFVTQLAADTGATVEFRLTDDHLKAYPRDRLLELAQDAGLEAVVANASKYPTSGSLRAAILEHAEALHARGYVPAVARFPEAGT